MPDAPRPARRVPPGPPLDSTDAALDAAAEITLEDLESAKDAARRHGRGTDLARILDATVEAAG
jgi:hypothetical protein